MIKIGIIAEYNPLHNGHQYHFNKIKELYPNSYVITILSSEFSERGELCVFNKFLRTSEALKLGSDLVLSNPLYYSLNNASIFAYSNVYFLNKCNVDKIVCGSENCDSSLFFKIYEIENTSSFKDLLKENLKKGLSFKASYTKALEYYNLSFKSNDMLNYFYYKAIQEINPNIELVLIKRINNDYLDKEINDSTIQSATSIRKLKNIEKYVPSFVNEDYITYGFRDVNKLIPLIKYSLNMKKENIREDIEGLSNRARNVSFNNYDELLDGLATKRYSTSKINRFIISNLLDIKNTPIEYYNFIRVLGFNSKGQEILNSIKENVEIFTSIKEGINPVFDLEINMDKILDISYNSNLISLDIKGPIKG